MPKAGLVDTNGLKSWVMAFSGELSMTSWLTSPEPAAPLPLDCELGGWFPWVAPAEFGEPLYEQAASPAARRPLTVSTRVLLLILALVATIGLAFFATAHWRIYRKRHQPVPCLDNRRCHFP